MAASLFVTIPDDNEHLVWGLKNMLKADHVDFFRSYVKANSLFQRYYTIYLTTELNRILASVGRTKQTTEPYCDKELLVRCYKKLQERKRTQPAIQQLGLDKKIEPFINLFTRASYS